MKPTRTRSHTVTPRPSRASRWLAAVLALGLVTWALATPARSPLGPSRGAVAVAAPAVVVPTGARTPKNVIVMISDGGGYNHLEAANHYLRGQAGSAPQQAWPVAMGLATWSASQERTGGAPYDPVKAWADSSWVLSPKEGGGGATDSGAAATAMACGQKTSSGAIGVDVDKQPIPNTRERAAALGKATGVITSVQISHATPAGFAAHNVSRNNYAEIAQEIVSGNADVIMGAGHPLFDSNGRPRAEDKADYKFVGGEETWAALVGSTAGTADGRAAWTLVQDRAAFQALAEGPTPQRVFGLAPVASTLQQGRSGKSDVPYEIPLIETVPTLAELTSAALNVLDNNPNGLFLMVEGGAVDWAGHGNQIARVIEEQIDFLAAVDAVIAWVEANSSWDETLVIVTADHETGHLTGPDYLRSDGEFNAAGAPWPLVGRGVGQVPDHRFGSGGHSNALVPLHVRGAGSEAFAASAVGVDPHRGPYADNTAVANVVFRLWADL